MAKHPSKKLSVQFAKATRLPAYRRIFHEIRTMIEDGSLKAGDRIESERELAARWQVSLMTARHALKALESEGFVVRRIGVGTFVATPKIHFNRLLSFTQQMASRGVDARSKVVATKILVDEPDASARLGIPPDRPLLKVERVRYGGSEPFAFEAAYLSLDEFPGLGEKVPLRRSLFETLQRDYDATIAFADEEVDATVAEGRIAHFLGIAPGSPVLRIRQVVHSGNGRKLLYDVGIYRADRHTLLIRRFS